MYYYEQFGCGDVAESFVWDKKQVSKSLLIDELNSGIRNLNFFFCERFFYFQKLEISKSRWFLGYQNFYTIPWDLVFEIIFQFLKLRGWYPYMWVIHSQNYSMC